MDLASIIGIIVCILLIIYGIITGDKGVAALGDFLDGQSAIITFGGAFCSVMASYPMKDFIEGLKSIALIFKAPALNVPEIIAKIIELSNVARKEGLLALEESANSLDEPFMKKGILLITL